MPTRAPLFDSATARFTATVVLPTPPLPAPTAITFLTPGSGGLPCSGAETDRTTNRDCTSTLATPGSFATASRACARERVALGRRRIGRLDREDHAIAVDADVLDELERHDVGVQVRVRDGLERIQDRFGCHKKFSLPRA